MARPREFDTDKAVTKAMDVFWAQGYDGASLPDLLDGMGITRGSLYKAFTDKRSLFLTVMDRYEQDAVAPAVALLSDNRITDGMDRIEQLFRSIVQAVREGDTRGCLLCTAAAGAAYDDTDIAELVHDLLAQMKTAFGTALQASEACAHVPADTRDILSDMLVSQYVGLRTLARGGLDATQLDNSVTALIALLRARA